MKKILLVPALIATMALATDYNWEITPVIGYNLPKDDKIIDDSLMYGGEIQYNGFDSKIKPELQYLYTEADNVGSTLETDISRIAINGVYNFDKIGEAIPLIKAGIGREDRSGVNGKAFLDLGLGMKVPFTEELALKLEALYIYSDGIGHDDAVSLLAGLNYSFGPKAQPAPVPTPVVDGDDDKDGVLNSVDKCPTTPADKVKTVDATGCCVDGDDDNDGVKNSLDKCPSTPAGKAVNADGCCLPEDDDKDGVTNDKDICPNTPLGDTVNSDGCPPTVKLHINFDNNSAVVHKDSYEKVQQHADFLNRYPNYSSKIVGHTSSTGEASYNMSLSIKRAKAVEAMLLEKGVPADRVSSSGMGETMPIADNATKAGRAQNRRIDAELIRK
jgi:OOP family OmpA-OmpF porin